MYIIISLRVKTIFRKNTTEKTHSTKLKTKTNYQFWFMYALILDNIKEIFSLYHVIKKLIVILPSAMSLLVNDEIPTIEEFQIVLEILEMEYQYFIFC